MAQWVAMEALENKKHAPRSCFFDSLGNLESATSRVATYRHALSAWFFSVRVYPLSHKEGYFQASQQLPRIRALSPGFLKSMYTNAFSGNLKLLVCVLAVQVDTAIRTLLHQDELWCFRHVQPFNEQRGQEMNFWEQQKLLKADYYPLSSRFEADHSVHRDRVLVESPGIAEWCLENW